jgi:hypothetical protein
MNPSDERHEWAGVPNLPDVRPTISITNALSPPNGYTEQVGTNGDTPQRACQSEHRPEHWKRGQSPRAVRLVVFRDGHGEYLCRRCVTVARRSASDELREQVAQTWPVEITA